MAGTATLTVDWSRYAAHYDSLAAANQAYRDLHRHVIELVLRLPLPAAARVLEIGAGTGNHILSLARSRPEWVAEAADNNACMLEQIRVKARTRQLDVALYDVNLNAPWPWCESHDLILAVHVVARLNDTPKALARAFDALRPGGCLVMADRARPIDLDGRIAAIKRDIYQTTLAGTRSPDKATAASDRFFRDNCEMIEASRLFDAHEPGDRQTWMPLAELCQAMRQQGYQIESASDGHYRNHTNVVVARKP